MESNNVQTFSGSKRTSPDSVEGDMESKKRTKLNQMDDDYQADHIYEAVEHALSDLFVPIGCLNWKAYVCNILNIKLQHKYTIEHQKYLPIIYEGVVVSHKLVDLVIEGRFHVFLKPKTSDEEIKYCFGGENDGLCGFYDKTSFKCVKVRKERDSEEEEPRFNDEKEQIALIRKFMSLSNSECEIVYKDSEVIYNEIYRDIKIVANLLFAEYGNAPREVFFRDYMAQILRHKYSVEEEVYIRDNSNPKNMCLSFRVDLVIAGKFMVELKRSFGSIFNSLGKHCKFRQRPLLQLVNYIRLTESSHGALVVFGNECIVKPVQISSSDADIQQNVVENGVNYENCDIRK